MSTNDLLEVGQRQAMVALGTNIFLRIEPTIDQLRNELTTRLPDQDAKDSVQDSFEMLKATANNLMSDDLYIRKENPNKFKEYVEGLKNILKMIYSGIPVPPNPGADLPDHIDFLKGNFIHTLENERRRITRNPNYIITETYCSITKFVRYLRNVEEHQNKPVDCLTGKRSYGNLYTLVSAFILVTYAYKEILEIWLETIKMRTP
jgi:hypothetical protein